MGTFAELYKVNGAAVPESKRKEFTERIEKLFQAGGMMEVKQINLADTEVMTIQKVKMNDDGMKFIYNYFEDDYWENAGYCKEGCYVWSNKIGWSFFNKAVISAYVLQELYTDGIAVTMEDGDPVTSWGHVGWINYLFNEKYHIKNFDPWKLFEALHTEWDTQQMDFGFGCTRYAFIGGCEIYAVQYGIDETIARFDSQEKKDLEELAWDEMKLALKALEQIFENGEEKEIQLKTIMSMIRMYYETNDKVKNIKNVYSESYCKLLDALRTFDAPAFVVKAISEKYNKDFWKLWLEIADVVKRKLEVLYGNDGYWVLPISTMEFFRQLPDDMILYWTEDGDFDFSEDLYDWFNSLKYKFDQYMDMKWCTEKPLNYIMHLMKKADENYYRIYTFTEFFEESLENLKDRRYQILWKLYDEMLCDPELKKEGDVIFVPEGPEYEKVGLCYWGKQPKRRLMREWCMTTTDKKNNKARVTLKRYMALLANKECRKRVFWF